VHGLGELHRPREVHRLVPVVGDADLALARLQRRGVHLELRGDGLEDDGTQPLGRLDRRVATHERDARRVGTEIDGRQARVGWMHVHVLGIEAEHLGHEVGQDRVGALTDIGGAAEHGHTAAAVRA